MKNTKNIREEARNLTEEFQKIISNDSTEGNYELVQRVIDFIQAQTISHIDINIDKAILLMGPTGAGKSTLTNYIAGGSHNLICERTKKGFILIPREPLAVVNQGEGGSTTIFPNIYTDISAFEGTAFIDCAGDFDSGGIIIEAINSIIRRNIANKISNIKIIVVNSQSSLNPEGAYGKNFRESLENLSKFLVNKNDFLQNIAFIMSHAERYEDIMEIAKALLTEVSENDSASKTIIENIKEKEALAVFCKPSSETSKNGQPYKAPDFLIDQRDSIINAINKIEFKKVEPGHFNIPKSLELETGMAQALKILKLHAASWLTKYVKGIPKIKVPVSELEKLEASIRQVKHLDQEAYLNDYVKGIELLKTHREYNSIIKEANSLTEEIKFISSLSNTNSLINWRKEIDIDKLLYEPILQEIQKVQSKTHYDNKDGKVKYFGYSVKLSDVAGYVSGKEVKSVQVFVMNEVELDQDFESSRTNLTLISPKWRVSTGVNINLSGANGVEQSSAEVGCDGKPGNPGCSSGNFYGLGSEFTGLDNLTLLLNGGNGGDGQKGGDGVKGIDGRSAKIQDVKPIEEYLWKSMIADRVTYNYYLVKGEAGSIGGNAGKSGVGGEGGYSGECKITQYERIGKEQDICEQLYKIEAKKGEKGRDGEEAKLGLRGRNGNDALKVYWNEASIDSSPMHKISSGLKGINIIPNCSYVKKGALSKELNTVGKQDSIRIEAVIDPKAEYVFELNTLNSELQCLGLEAFFDVYGTREII